MSKKPHTWAEIRATLEFLGDCGDLADLAKEAGLDPASMSGFVAEHGARGPAVYFGDTRSGEPYHVVTREHGVAVVTRAKRDGEVIIPARA